MPPSPALPYDAALARRAAAAGGDVDLSLALARQLGEVARALGTETLRYLSALATLGRADLTVARVVEPHLDALAILGQAGVEAPAAESTWGVFAAAGPDDTLAADGNVLTGTKSWCSLGDRLSNAIVTVQQQAFAVDLQGVRRTGPRWVARGLAAVDSSGLVFDGCPAVEVGGPGWYLARPGFAWGGIGVAAVWVGAARALFETLLAGARRRSPDQLALVHIGSLDELLYAAEVALSRAAAEIDADRGGGDAGVILAARTRAIAARTAEEALRIAGHALGPAPLALDEEHARRVADLGLYLRQHHAERDLARLGSAVLAAA